MRPKTGLDRLALPTGWPHRPPHAGRRGAQILVLACPVKRPVTRILTSLLCGDGLLSTQRPWRAAFIVLAQRDIVELGLVSLAKHPSASIRYPLCAELESRWDSNTNPVIGFRGRLLCHCSPSRSFLERTAGSSEMSSGRRSRRAASAATASSVARMLEL